MKGFKLNESGDVVIENGDIQIIEGNELLNQKCMQVVGTNKGEWFTNEDEGIDFHTILKKNPDDNEIRDEVADALTQVDETLVIQNFETEQRNRFLSVKFTATNSDGAEVGGEISYGGSN